MDGGRTLVTHILAPLIAGYLQLMFQLNGEISSAMVSMEVKGDRPWGRGLNYRSLSVDLPSGERLVLKGQSGDVVFQGYTRLR